MLWLLLAGGALAGQKQRDAVWVKGLGVDATPGTNYLKVELPPSRKAGVIVESVDALIDKLKNEARVL